MKVSHVTNVFREMSSGLYSLYEKTNEDGWETRTEDTEKEPPWKGLVVGNEFTLVRGT